MRLNTFDAVYSNEPKTANMKKINNNNRSLICSNEVSAHLCDDECFYRFCTLSNPFAWYKRRAMLNTNYNNESCTHFTATNYSCFTLSHLKLDCSIQLKSIQTANFCRFQMCIEIDLFLDVCSPRYTATGWVSTTVATTINRMKKAKIRSGEPFQPRIAVALNAQL